MIPLRVLVCGSDSIALQPISQLLSDEGVKVKTTTRIMECLYRSSLEWDFLLVDLDRLTKNLCGLLPAIRRQFPNLYVVGISIQPTTDRNFFLDGNLDLDEYLFKLPRPEDLIVCFPRVAANYLCDAAGLRPN